MNFKVGDRVRVVKVRPHLGHKIGNTGVIVKFIPKGRPDMDEVYIRWDSNPTHMDCVWANQFELNEVPW